MKTKMSDLPKDLTEEILCRTTLTSTRAVRTTCKMWNTLLSKDENFTKTHLARRAAMEKEREGEFLAIMVINFSVYLMSVNLKNNYDPYVKPQGKLISLKDDDDSDKLEISRVSHCDGLVLCTTADYTRLVVWNPYTGQTQWIRVESRSVYKAFWFGHVLGYNKSKSKSYKILRYVNIGHNVPIHEIYEFCNSSWRVLDVTPDWTLGCNSYGVSLKGNAYWFAHDSEGEEGRVPDFLICFDFTTERFGPRLQVPFVVESWDADTVILSSSVVRGEEQIAALVQLDAIGDMEIWITTKIEHNAVSWTKFLKVDMLPLGGLHYFYDGGSFLVDEERRAVVVIDRLQTGNTAFIFGENGYYRKVYLGEIIFPAVRFPLACSYVPSSVQINQPAPDVLERMFPLTTQLTWWEKMDTTKKWISQKLQQAKTRVSRLCAPMFQVFQCQSTNPHQMYWIIALLLSAIMFFTQF